jgi:hypothetical protein
MIIFQARAEATPVVTDPWRLRRVVLQYLELTGLMAQRWLRSDDPRPSDGNDRYPDDPRAVHQGNFTAFQRR